MSVWLTAARVAAGLNVVLLVALSYVWATNYRRHGATHTLGLLVFGVVLLVENALWVGLYTLVPDFYGWFTVTSGLVQAGVTMLCGLELVALLFLARVTLT
jgi:hypothetical protein